MRTRALFLLYALGVLALTMPFAWAHRPRFDTRPWWEMVHWIPFWVDPVSMALNVVLFVPFGILVPLLWPWAAPARRLGWLSLSTSLAIELTQLIFLITLDVRRTVDINDLIANTGGALIGLWILRSVRARQPAASR